MSLVSQEQLLQNQTKLEQLALKQNSSQANKQAQRARSLASTAVLSASTAPPATSVEIDFSNPLVTTLPTHANPTDVLASRFDTWRIIISALAHYLKEIVAVNEEITRQQIRLHHAITFPFLTQGLDGDFYQPLRVSSLASPSGRSGASNPLTGQLFHNNKDSLKADTVDVDLSKQNNEFEIAKKMFLPLGSGSIQDLPTILYQYHSNAALLSQATSKELSTGVVPRLDDLKRDLLVKIKEIKALQSDFSNKVDKLQRDTQVALSTYQKSVDIAKLSPSQLDPKNDPYLLKLILDRSIKRQMTEENYLHEAFNNIQNSGCELEKVVYVELQSALTVYAKLVGQQAQNVFDGLLAKLDSTILNKDPTIEWENFIVNDSKNFIPLSLPMRRVSEIKYTNQYDPIVVDYRSGYLERKSKYLKSYAKGYYVLTPCFLHEFKTNDRKKDPIPVMSLPVSELKVVEHSKRDEENPGGYHKFIITSSGGSGGGLLGRGHKWVFRCDGYSNMMNWYNDIKKLASLPSPMARAQLSGERKKQKRMVSGTTTVASSVITGTGGDLTREGSIMNHSTNRSTYDATSTINIDSSMTSPQESKPVQPGKFSIDPSMIDPVVTVPVTTESVYQNDRAHIASAPSDSYPSHEKDILSEQSRIMEEQAALEQQQRDLIDKQRDLAQRAMSLNSHTMSLNSQMNGSQAGAALNPLRESNNTGANQDFEKVGEFNS